MPLVGYVCPTGTPTNKYQRPGQRNKVEHCLSKCPRPCVSPPLLAKMWDAERKNHHVGTYLSASMLTGDGCARQTWFERQPDTELYEIPRRRYWPFRGTIVHHMIEGATDVIAKYGWIQEFRLSVPLTFPDLFAPNFDENGMWDGTYDESRPLIITLGGTLDCYNPYLRVLDDFKTISDLRLQKFLKGGDGGTLHPQVKDSWVMQTNIYGWMLGQTTIPQDIRDQFQTLGLRPIRKDKFPSPQRIRIQVLSMMELPLTGNTYRAVGRDKTEYDILDMPILPEEQVESYVRERALKWYRWLVLGEKPPVVDEEKSWMCGLVNGKPTSTPCPFNAEIYKEGLCNPSAEREGQLVTLARASR